jgi:cellulose synthase/poly-beta-1,6-N-acetylglucosamine synthase-like glycosyltransferase
MIKQIHSNIIKNETLFRLFRQESTLPKAPSNIEKHIYGNGDFKLYALTALLTAGLAVYGQVIWVLSDKDRYPFFVSIVIFVLFTLITYMTAFFRKSFNQNSHNIMVKHYYDKPTTKSYPSVDIYLATCGEELDVLENAYKYVSKLEWYGDLFVYVLDDKGDQEVKQLSNKYGFNYIHRPVPGELKKAGNVRHGFSVTDGDYFVIFDADFCPRHDFLIETMPYFDNDKNLGLIQTPQYFHLTKNSNYIELGSTAKEEFFYRSIQPARDAFNGSMCVGTNAIYKREACTNMGGVYPLEHSEDIHTGFTLIKEGWKLKYIPLVLAKGMAPSTINAYFSQQYRWGLGTLMQIFDKNFWFAKIPFFIKLNYINAIFYYLTVATGVILNPITVLLTVMFFPVQLKFFEIIFFVPYFLFNYLVHPIWQKSPWSIKCISTNIIANTSYLFALFDLITGSTMDWIPTGQLTKKSGKKARYTQFIWFLGLWHLITYSLILYFSLMNMVGWDDYNFYPVIFFAGFNILITLSIFEPIKAINSVFDNLLNLLGLKIFVNQLRSISLVATLVILLSGITVLAINKEGRANLMATINNLTFERNNQNAFLPIPILGNKNNNDDTAKENSVQQSQLDLKSNLTPKPETKKEELKLPTDKSTTPPTTDKKDQPKTETTIPTIEVPKTSDTPAIDPNTPTQTPTKPIDPKPITPVKPTTPDTTTTVPPSTDTQEITSPPPLGRNMQQN